MLLLIGTILSFLATTCIAGPLQLVQANATLLNAQGYMCGVYDGEDSIILSEGTGGTFRVFHKYSISTDTIHTLGPFHQYFGALISNERGHIFYFGGRDRAGYSPEIWQINMTNPDDWEIVGRLPYPILRLATIWDKYEFVYLFGGYNISGRIQDDIFRFSTITHNLEHIGKLPYGLDSVSSVYDARNSVGYLLGGTSPHTDGSSGILEFDTRSHRVAVVNATLPLPTKAPCSIWTGKYVYIIGGEDYDQDIIARFNPAVNLVEEIPVLNYSSYLAGAFCEYVKPLHRVYIFGGYFGSGYTGQISYIDLELDE